MKNSFVRVLAVIFVLGGFLKASGQTNMVRVEGGTFQMGRGMNKSGSWHPVTLDDFEIADCEITHDEMERVMDWALDAGKLRLSDGYLINRAGREQKLFLRNRLGWSEEKERFSVYNGNVGKPFVLTWYGAAAYCNYRSEMEGLQPCYKMRGIGRWTCDFKASGYRLPTEAEWEYAARGGQGCPHRKYSGSDDPDEVAWHAENSKVEQVYTETIKGYDTEVNGILMEVPDRTIKKIRMVPELRQIRLKKPNALGLYDMSGNASEWCNDWLGRYQNGEQKNPTGAEKPIKKSAQWCVIRGGGYRRPVSECTVFYRNGHRPEEGTAGFRLARSIVPVAEDPSVVETATR